MIKGLGVDLVKVLRISNILDRWGERFIRKIFTPLEIDYCLSKKDSTVHFAARFAAKEALFKVLGTGLNGVSWQEVEVRNNNIGKPELIISGKCQEIASKNNINTLHLSISHEKEYVIAQVIGEEDEK